MNTYPVITEDGELLWIKGELNGLHGLDIEHKQVLKSAAGFYIGWLSKADWYEKQEESDPEEFWEPWARDSQHYWPTRQEAQDAMLSGNYTVKF